MPLIRNLTYRQPSLVSECRGTDRRGVSRVDRSDRRVELRRRAEIEADWGGGRLASCEAANFLFLLVSLAIICLL